MRAVLLPLILFAALSLPSVSVHAQEMASVDQLKFMQPYIGEWETEDGGTSKWHWTLNGRFLENEMRNSDGYVTLRAFTGWDGTQKAVTSTAFASNGTVATQTWSRKGENSIVLCTSNGKYLGTMTPIDKDSWSFEFANGKQVVWKRKQ